MKANLLRAVKFALARSRPLSDHPDANVLAAFAENTLLARERATVAGHLADCADCRELLALAFGTVEPAAVVERRPVRRWSPVWNWAASVAVVCIVVSAVWEFRAQRAVPVGAPPGPPAIHASVPPAMSVEAPTAAATRAPVRRFTPPPSKALHANVVKQLELPPPPPVLPQETQQTMEVTHFKLPRDRPRAQVARPGVHDMILEAQAPPIPACSAAARRNETPAFRAFVVPEPVDWRIASGMLQCSHDGTTWETISIGGQVAFRTVAPRFGSDVWAGGSDGALFHSTDSGLHWWRVANDVTGTIVEIRPSGADEAVVITEDGRTWRITDNPR
jgi:hypothetical protein